MNCNGVMDPVNDHFGTHPSCDMKLLAVDDEEKPFESMLKSQIMDMVKWFEKQSPRSRQQMIGPSEIGTPCDRRVGYRLAGVPRCNVDFDPWASIVGTAIHSWLDEAVTAWMREHQSTAWSTETTLVISEFVRGHADLYSHDHKAVIDYKSVGPDVMRKIKKDGPPPGYQIQTHVYGYGFEQKGLPVERVCLVFLPRAGWLRDMYIWSDRYLPDVARGAVVRLRLIAQQILNLEILKDGNSYRWQDLEAYPSNDCGWCPWYDPGREPDRVADDTGCGGR